MSLISRTISQLFGGVSQQPPQLRSDSQCEAMDNCWPDPAVGLAKRPPSIQVARLNETTGTDRAVHFINRDATERYAVVADLGELRVYDMTTGVEKTVVYEDGQGYLITTDPKNDLAFLTVADTTYVVNKTTTVALEPVVDTSSETMWSKMRITSLPPTTGSCPGLAQVHLRIDGVQFSAALTSYPTKAAIANRLAVLATAARPDLVVVSDGIDSVTVTAPPGVAIAVDGYSVAAYYITPYGVSFCIAGPWSGVTITSGGKLNGYIGFVYIQAGVARQTYTVSLDGADYSFTVAADGANALTTTIAEGLKTAIPAATYSVIRMGSILKIQRNDSAEFSFSAKDSYGDQGLTYFTDAVDSQSDLPPNFWDGFIIKIRGAQTAGAPAYYVTFRDGGWYETVAPGLQNKLDSATMPFKLVRQSDGTFKFSRIQWNPREVGDTDSNPVPSFVGQKLNNIFFYRERLGFLSGENIVMSRAASYYNFFGTTVSEVLDDDPIDVSVADTRVSQLYHAISFQQSLLVFSDTAQFQLTGADILSPQTAKLDATTRFHSSKTVPPVSAGRDVYFAVNRGLYTSMREYFVLDDGINPDAVDVTAHVPSYVPNNLRGMVASSLVDAVMTFSTTSGNTIYFHKFLWSGDQKVQSAWGTITLDAGATLLGFEFIETRLYAVVQRSDGTYLQYMDFQANLVEPGMDFQVHLDRRYSLTGVYNDVTKKTTWTLPYADTQDYSVVLGPDWGTKAGQQVQTTKVSTTAIEGNGDLSAHAAFVGIPYTMRYTFSELYIKDNEKQAITNGRLMLKNLEVEFANTSYFRGEVTAPQRDTATYAFNGSYLGTASSIIGQVNISTGRFKFPVITENRGATIELVNDSPLPSTFQTVSWEGLFAQRSKRV